MARTHGTGRLRVARGSRSVIPSVGRFSLRLLLARPLRQSLVGSCQTAERGSRRRRGCCCEYGSPGLLYAHARLREGAVPRAGLGDAAGPLVCGQESLVRGRVPGESAALYLWRAALLVRLLPRRARSGSRDDGVPWRCLPCAPCVDARRARNAQCVAMQRQPVGAPKKKKNVFRSTSRRNTPRKTDGRRRPMPQQIWKGPEIKIQDAPPRRLTSAAAAHDAWETARPFYATTNLLAASLVYAQMP